MAHTSTCKLMRSMTVVTHCICDCTDRYSLRMGHYVWPAILLWALDRVLRWCRMLLFAQFSSSDNASIDVLSPNFMRVTADKPRFFYWSPGQCAYLTLPSVGLVAHPFTISSVDTKSKQDKLIFLIRVHDGFTRRVLNKANGQRTRLLLDGPYSSPPVTRGFDGVVLIAGNSPSTCAGTLLSVIS